MPIYTYACRFCGARADRLFAHAQRPASLLCACAGEMALTIAATAPPVIAGRPGAREGTRTTSDAREGYVTTYASTTAIVREKGSAPVLVDWRCPAADCGERFHDVYDTKPAVRPPCPKCGATSEEVLGVPGADWFTMMYGATGGYYDQGLGCWLNSAAHRRQVMDERGLVEYGEVGEIHDDARRKQNERADREDGVIREMLRGYEHGPDAAAMKTARDRGEVQDWRWAIDAVGGLDKG